MEPQASPLGEGTFPHIPRVRPVSRRHQLQVAQLPLGRLASLACLPAPCIGVLLSPPAPVPRTLPDSVLVMREGFTDRTCQQYQKSVSPTQPNLFLPPGHHKISGRHPVQTHCAHWGPRDARVTELSILLQECSFCLILEWRELRPGTGKPFTRMCFSLLVTGPGLDPRPHA